jgi:nucleotide-binding universal stress UspA family protein
MEPFAPRRILATTDFSEVSTWALRHAVMWAQRYQAELTVLHAQEFPPIGTDPYFGSYSLAGLVEATQEAVTQQLAEYVAKEVPPDVPAHSKLLTGPPAAVIEECAASMHADLVVLGTHGRGGVSRLLLGSVAERALRMAQRPTLIVRQPGADGTSEGAEVPPPTLHLQQILCPVNYTDVARTAFEHACGVARTFGAGLTVVFAVEPTEGALAAGALRGAEEQLRAWLPIEPDAACQMQPIVRHGDAGEQVITLAQEAKVDLVVIGAQHRRFVDTTVLGVTTVRVTRHAPCPVLVVPRPV